MAEDSTKGLALAILGVVALVAVVGLLLVFLTSKNTGKVSDFGYQGVYADGFRAANAERRVAELPQEQQWVEEVQEDYDASVGGWPPISSSDPRLQRQRQGISGNKAVLE